VLIGGADRAGLQHLTQVTADRLKKIGVNSTAIFRLGHRLGAAPRMTARQGGWNLFQHQRQRRAARQVPVAIPFDIRNLRRQEFRRWPFDEQRRRCAGVIPRDDRRKQKALVEAMAQAPLGGVPYVPLGQLNRPFCGAGTSPRPQGEHLVFWNIEELMPKRAGDRHHCGWLTSWTARSTVPRRRAPSRGSSILMVHGLTLISIASSRGAPAAPGGGAVSLPLPHMRDQISRSRKISSSRITIQRRRRVNLAAADGGEIVLLARLRLHKSPAMPPRR